ncbi:protein-tyrosine phosphatase-like protein [Thelephora terrestris]|uniref:protein-tyrosine-phosphatase n=1 Tax=Thelephora terrestris TaxID=56493 RepID=A0A9P6H3X2_9AGAM|nr:protein-tyrosine phosphatase-like protein [Thelephora terrestris]
MIRFDGVPPEIIQAMCTPMHQILLPPPAQHLGHLWLGSFAAISDNDLLRKHRITHIVQVIDVSWLPPVNDPNMTVTRIDIMDIPSADLKSHLDAACAGIEKSLTSGKNVLVHCQQGISRSASVVIAYLIKKYDMSYEYAYAFVKRYRACVEPNSGFVKCLKEWEIRQRPHITRSQTEYVSFPPTVFPHDHLTYR